MANTQNTPANALFANPFGSAIWKTKFRWTFYLQPKCPGFRPIGISALKSAKRPSMKIDPIEITYLGNKVYVPNIKGIEELSVVYLDVSNNTLESSALYDYIGAVYTSGTSAVKDYTASGILTLYDGCLQGLEQWIFDDLWPTSVDFGDLGYEDNSLAEIAISFRYSQFSYIPLCSRTQVSPCCTSC